MEIETGANRASIDWRDLVLIGQNRSLALRMRIKQSIADSESWRELCERLRFNLLSSFPVFDTFHVTVHIFIH